MPIYDNHDVPNAQRRAPQVSRNTGEGSDREGYPPADQEQCEDYEKRNHRLDLSST